MYDKQLCELELRLHRMEEEVRQLRARSHHSSRLGRFGLAVCGVACVAVLGTIKLTPVTAQSDNRPEQGRPMSVLQIPVDIQDGNKKTIVRIDDDPVPYIWLLGAQGSVKLTVAETGGAIAIRNTSRDTPSGVFYDTNGDGMLLLRGKDGKNIAEVGKAGLLAFNNAEIAVASLGPTSNGVGRLSLGDSDGDAMVEGGILDDGRGVVRAYPYNPRTGEILTGSNLIIGAKK